MENSSKLTLAAMLANELKAILISWDDYDDVSIEPENYIHWYQNGQDYAAFERKVLSKVLDDVIANIACNTIYYF